MSDPTSGMLTLRETPAPLPVPGLVQPSDADPTGAPFDDDLWNLDVAPAPAPDRSLLFTVGDQSLAVSIRVLRDVLPIEAITTVPGAPSWVLGLTNVRGTVVGVVDLACYLGRGATEPRGGRLIVCRAGPRTVAFAVADARRIVDHAPADVTPVAGVSGRTGRYVHAVIPIDGEPVPLLDVGQLLADDELVRA